MAEIDTPNNFEGTPGYLAGEAEFFNQLHTNQFLHTERESTIDNLFDKDKQYNNSADSDVTRNQKSREFFQTLKHSFRNQNYRYFCLIDYGINTFDTSKNLNFNNHMTIFPWSMVNYLDASGTPRRQFIARSNFLTNGQVRGSLTQYRNDMQDRSLTVVFFHNNANNDIQALIRYIEMATSIVTAEPKKMKHPLFGELVFANNFERNSYLEDFYQNQLWEKYARKKMPLYSKMAMKYLRHPTLKDLYDDDVSNEEVELLCRQFDIFSNHNSFTNEPDLLDFVTTKCKLEPKWNSSKSKKKNDSIVNLEPIKI